MQVLTPSILLKATGCSTTNSVVFAPLLQEVFEIYEINTVNRVADFLSQVSHESGSFRWLKEIWGPTTAQRSYEGRTNLGNIQLGDGKRYLGRGPLQVTGRANYASLRDKLRARLGDIVPDFEENPVALEDPKWGLYAAGEYWHSRNCNAASDMQDIEALTKKINGGLNGLADRKLRRMQAINALTTKAEIVAEVPVPIQPVSQLIQTQPTKEKNMPLVPFVGLALEALMTVVPDLLQVFGGKSEVAQRNVKAATTVIEAAKKAVGASNEQELIETINAGSPETTIALTKAVREVWWEISTDNSGIPAAREANKDFALSGQKFWTSPAFIVTTFIFGLLGTLLADFLFVHPASYSAELRTQIVTALIAFGSSGLAYWLGTSNSSTRKTELLAASQPADSSK